MKIKKNSSWEIIAVPYSIGTRRVLTLVVSVAKRTILNLLLMHATMRDLYNCSFLSSKNIELNLVPYSISHIARGCRWI